MTLLVAVTTAFLTTFMGSALNLSIPNIEKEFTVGAAVVGWVVSTYIFAVSAINVPVGKIADAVGRKKILVTGIGLFTVACILSVFSVSIWMLLAMRLVQGIAASMLFATNNAILLEAFPPEKHGQALGKSVAATYTGLSLGPVIGGVLNHNFGWRAVFLASAVVGLVAFAVAVKELPKDNMRKPADSRSHYDFKGGILYMLMIMGVIFGLTNLTVNSYSWMILAGGLILGVFFVMTEKKAEDPIIKISMFADDPVFMLSNLAAMLNYGATFALSYLPSIFLQAVQGCSSQTAGLILIAQPVVMALLSPKMGALSDRIAPYKLATAGMAICTIGLVVFTRLDQGMSNAVIIGLMIFTGIGFAMFSSPNTKAIMSRVRQEDYSVANAITATMRNLGQSFSMAIVTIVMGSVLGNSTFSSAGQDNLIHAMRISFVVFVILGVCATVMSFMRSGKSETKRQDK